MNGPDSLVATAAYQPEPTAAAAARRFVRDTLQSWLIGETAAEGHGLVDDAVLLTSELVTNAIVHAGTAVEVTCRLADGGVEVVVSDGHPARLVPEPPGNEHIPAERTSGRGLLLPAALASAWGVSYGRAAKAVWFRIGPTETGAAGDDGGPGAAVGASFAPAATGLDASAALAAALRQVPVTAGAKGAVPGQRPARWPAPPFGEPAFGELLATAVEAARTAVAADAAYTLVPDEDGDLRLRAAAGSFPAVAAAGPADRGPCSGRDGAGLVNDPGVGSLAAMRAAAGAAPSVLTVPFVVDGRITGLLAVASATPGRFRDDEAVRLQQLADRWGPPLERARLGELERVRRGRIVAMAQARELLTAEWGRDEMLALAGEAAVPRLVPWCVVLLPEDGAVLRTVYARHAQEDLSAPLAWLLDQVAEVMGAAQLTPRPAGAARPAALARWLLAVPGLPQAPVGADALAADAAWCFPLDVGTNGGLLAVGHRRDERLPREVAELAADLASRIGVALGNARLVGQQR